MTKYAIALLLPALMTTACGGGAEKTSVAEATDTVAPPPPAALPDVAARLAETDSLKTFAAAAAKAGVLVGEGKAFTVFAPVNRAVADPKALDNPEVLNLHVVEGKLFSDDVMTQKTLKTLSGKEVKVELDGKSLKINGVRVVEADIKAENGVIHVLESALK